MRAVQAFLAGAIVLAFCLVLAGRATAGPIPKPFNLGGGTVKEVVDTISSVPVDCADFPAASDTYVWKAQLTNVRKAFKADFNTEAIFIVFLSNSCNITNNITNVLEIPPGLAKIKTDKTTGIVTITFNGAVPDFNAFNTASSLLPPFFNDLDLVVKYNSSTSAQGGLAPGAGTFQLSGNANLCDAINNGPPQCLFLDIAIGQGNAYDCTCASLPTVVTMDISSLFP